MKTSNAFREKAIITAEKELMIAMKSSNIQLLDELIHEDLLFVIPNGQLVTKAMDIESYRSGNMKIIEITFADMTINLIGDNAIVSVTIEMSGSFLDHKLDGKYQFIRVWKSINDQWKIIAGSSTQL